MSDTISGARKPDPADAPDTVPDVGGPNEASPLRERRSVVVAAQVGVLVAFLGLWQLLASTGTIEERFFGSPLGTIEQLVQLFEAGTLIDNTQATLTAVLVSLLIGVPLGTAAGLALALFPFLDRVMSPFIVPLNSLPRIAFAPLFLLWFGLTLWAKVALSVTIIFFIMLLNTRAGVRNVEPDLISVSRLLGLSSRKVMQKVALPFSVPSVVAGFRLCVTYGLLGVVASEMIAARDGLGLLIVSNSNSMNTNGVFAVLLTLAVVSVLLDQVTRRVEGRLLRWQ